jgi:hypothetical protein
MPDIKENFGSSTAITATGLASLAQAAAFELAAVDNGSNKFLDAMLNLAFKLQAGSPASDKAIYVWFYGSEDGTNYTDNATGSAASLTMRVPTNLRGPFVINAPDSGGLTWKAVIGSVASFFGGVLPRKWGIVVQNMTNITFSATGGDHVVTFTGVYATSS